VTKNNDMRGSEIEKRIVAYAKSKNCMAIKMRDVINGCPDRQFISPNGRVLFIEFKGRNERLSAAQQEYIRCLAEHNCYVAVVRGVDEGKDIIDDLLEDY